MNEFTNLLVRNLPDQAAKVINVTGISTVEELYLLMWAFPSISELDEVDFAQLSNEALRCTNMTETQVKSNLASGGLSRTRQSRFTFGGTAVEQSKWSVKTRVTLRDYDEQPGIIWEQLPSVKVGYQTQCEWPVKNQGERSTCVAFALSALLEADMCRKTGSIDPYSEQFLYYATKTRYCEAPTEDGTTIRAARNALEMSGVCLDDRLPYNPTLTQNTPSQESFDDAFSRRRHSFLYTGTGTSRASVVVLKLLGISGEVAISVPVFADPQNLRNGLTNWNTAVGVNYGIVINPPPTAVVVGGHAVCIVGFEPDSSERGGGYFVFRNSWGTDWASDLPNPEFSKAPERGYGQISSSYLDRFLWEAVRLGDD